MEDKKGIIAGIISLIILIAFIVFLIVLFTRVTGVDTKVNELKAEIISLKEQIKSEPNPEFTSSTPYVSIVAENSVGETELKKCNSFNVSWSGANINESTCKVAHTNLNNPNGTSLNGSFTTIYSSTKEQSMSDCGLVGQQQFTITCEGTDGMTYTHSTAINFSE